MVVPSVLPHGCNESIAHGSSEGVCLNSVLIDNLIPLFVDPGVSKVAGLQFISFVKGPFLGEDGFVVVAQKLVLRFLEEAPVFSG